MDRHKPDSSREPLPPDSVPRKAPDDNDTIDDATETPNPPRTTKHGITAPKFGSAGSGGLELEPGPERD